MTGRGCHRGCSGVETGPARRHLIRSRRSRAATSRMSCGRNRVVPCSFADLRKSGRRKLSDTKAGPLPTRPLRHSRYHAQLTARTLGSPTIRCAHAPPSSPGDPGIPLHITQRGINRRAIFLDDDDRRHDPRLLGDSAARHGLYIRLRSDGQPRASARQLQRVWQGAPGHAPTGPDVRNRLQSTPSTQRNAV